MVITARRVISVFLVLFLCLGGICALDVSTRVTELKTHPDFWAGVFPTDVSYRITLSGFEFIQDRITDIGLELSTGTTARVLTRNPLTGLPTGEKKAFDAMYAAWRIGVQQGLWHSEKTGKDLVTFDAAFEGRWEMTMDPLLQTGSRTGHLFSEPEFNLVSFMELKGAPDLSGDRQLFAMGFRAAGKFNDYILKTANTNGVKAEFEMEWFPKSMNISSDTGGVVDFFRLWLFADYAKMFFRKADDEGKNLYSMGMTSDLEMRVLAGSAVPKYAERLKGSIWWYEPENSTFLIRNTTKLNYYGEQFLGACVPRAYAFLDLSYTGGKLNNCIDKSLSSILTGSAGLHLELQVYEVLEIYYELGYVFLYTGENPDSFIGYRPLNKADNTIKVKVSIEI